MRETAGSYRGALHVIAGVMAVSTLLPILVRPPHALDIGTSGKVSHRVPKSGCDPIASLD
jgi:hypothetical protein